MRPCRRICSMRLFSWATTKSTFCCCSLFSKSTTQLPARFRANSEGARPPPRRFGLWRIVDCQTQRRIRHATFQGNLPDNRLRLGAPDRERSPRFGAHFCSAKTFRPVARLSIKGRKIQSVRAATHFEPTKGVHLVVECEDKSPTLWTFHSDFSAPVVGRVVEAAEETPTEAADRAVPETPLDAAVQADTPVEAGKARLRLPPPPQVEMSPP
jgi:hypothetical protein